MQVLTKRENNFGPNNFTPFIKQKNNGNLQVVKISWSPPTPKKFNSVLGDQIDHFRILWIWYGKYNIRVGSGSS